MPEAHRGRGARTRAGHNGRDRRRSLLGMILLVAMAVSSATVAGIVYGRMPPATRPLFLTRQTAARAGISYGSLSSSLLPQITR